MPPMILPIVVAVAAASVPDASLVSLQATTPGVRVHVDATGRVDRLYGKPMASGLTPIDAAATFLAEHGGIWNLDPANLILADAATGQPLMHDANGTPRFVRFRYAQHAHSLPVFGAAVDVLVRSESNEVVLAASTTRDIGGWPAPTTPRLITQTARAAAQRLLGPETVLRGEPFACVFAGTGSEPAAPTMAIQAIAQRGSGGDVDYAKVQLVLDAATGAILHHEDLIVHCNAMLSAAQAAATGDITGVVQASVNDGWSAWECDPTTLSPLAWIQVFADGSPVTTNAEGEFTISATGPVLLETELRGLWFDVNNDAGADDARSINASDGDHIEFHFNDELDELYMSQSVAYRDSNDVRDFTLAVNPDYPTIGTQTAFPVNVNLGSTCNAYYDYESINFYQSGGGCNNTAFGHVVYHEYGHHLIAVAGSGQGAYGEGMADCIALLMTSDTVMAPGFFQGNCVSGIRDADNSCQYSGTGCSSCGSEIHACGQLLSGCVWDTWESLRLTNPLSADQIIRALTINSILLHTGTEIDDAIAIDFVTLDDDDGDIDNGSPNYDAIKAGFGAHGLNVPPIAWLDVSFPNGLPSHVSPGGGTTLVVEIADLLGTYDPDSAILLVKGDGNTTQHPLEDLGNGTSLATFPPVECGIDAEYYLWLKTTDNANVFVPAGAPDDRFTAVSAWSEPEIVFSDDATDDPGWTVSGDATDGIWERGIPNGGNGRPESDCGTDNWCWMTENRTGGGDDVDGGSTILTSPRIDATDTLEISYCWWYRNMGGGDNVEDDIWVVNVSDDDGATWTLLHETGTTGPDVTGNWQTSIFSLVDLPDFEINELFRIQFVASDLNQTSRVEAAIDNVEMIRIDCSEQPCDGDLDGDGIVGTNEILAVLDAWGDCTDCEADITGDGTVNVDDLLYIVSAFGPCP